MAFKGGFSTPPPRGYFLTYFFCIVHLFAKKPPTWNTTERSLWSAANFVNNQIYNFLSILLLKLWCHYQNTYTKLSICHIINFEGSIFCQLSTFRFFLILLALKTLAMYSQKTKFSQRPLPIQESSALVLVRPLVGTHCHRKKNLATGLAEDNSVE